MNAIGSSRPFAAAPSPPTDREFRSFQQLIEREAGIHLAPHKKALLAGRLNRRIRELGLPSFGSYYERVVDGDDGELTHLLDAIATNETRFFREPEHFRVLADHIVPELVQLAESGRKARGVRVWSAACSTGEEPYSIAMVLRRCLPQDWPVEVVATDISTRVLARAQAGTWPIAKSREIPPEHLKQFMLRGSGSQAGNMKVGKELRSLVTFSRINLASDPPPGPARFDLIFCRNVLIYFAKDTKLRVVDKLLHGLLPDGYLFLGHAETLNGTALEMEPVSANIYRRVTSSSERGHARRNRARR